ncbi:MAG TPA: wax ester/triacylglycerol synthase domain-containing protein [Candidatus Dormibacteraeota bacterium]|nr:wax ester/triacylglycerol synthase domain-containing protein [Candidatus Dormibacteraeota bacterium]
MNRAESMTAAEAAFLEFEREGLPMHVAGITVLDATEPVTMDELRRAVATRLRGLPRLHQTAHSRWTPAGRIDFTAHVFHHQLAHASQFHPVCAQIHQAPLDRGRPLWEVHLIDGLAHHQQALVIKTHHAIGDGLAGMKIAEALFDRSETTFAQSAPELRFVHNGSRATVAVLQDLVGLAFTASSGPLAAEGPFNGRVGSERAFAAAALDIDRVRVLKQQLGGSVDDVIVAIVSVGLRRYLENVGYPTIPAALRAMLPVSTQAFMPGAHLGNHVSAVFIDLPMQVDGLATLVRHIAAAKAVVRTAHAAAGGAVAVEAVGRLPRPLRAAVLRTVSELPFANLVISDIPGPDRPQHFLGRNVIACYPMMPLGGNVGLSIAAVGMGHVIGVGVTADPGIVPDVRRLAKAIETAAA